MNETQKTTVVSLSSIKGGVGKTNITILLANCMASAGKKVVLIDSDLNNSLSFYYLDDAMMEKTKKQNFAAALSDEKNNLCDYAVQTRVPGVELIASSPYLADLRTINEKRLKRMIPSLYGAYDILLIDCHPTYDNIVLNALYAADYVITPVLKDLFSYNAAVFLSEVLPRDVEGLENWFVLLNGYDKRYEEAKSGRQNEYIELYKAKGLPLTPQETWFPWTVQIRMITDYRKKLSRTGSTPGAVFCPPLYVAAVELARCFFDGEFEPGEAF